MIKHTHAASPRHTLSAYSDNAAVIEGSDGDAFLCRCPSGRYAAVSESIDFRDQGRDAQPPDRHRAVSRRGDRRRWRDSRRRCKRPRRQTEGRPDRFRHVVSAHSRVCRERGNPSARCRRAWPPRSRSCATARSVRRRSTTNSGGRAWAAISARSRTRPAKPNLRLGYDKPIMIAGGLANMRPGTCKRSTLQPGDAVIVLGGPAMLIGLGGGAASSVAGGDSSEELDFASVQRDNAEMQRRCQEVIDHCWALGEANPIVSIHDVGAGGLSNAIPEILHDSQVGGRIDLRRIPSRRSATVADADLVQRGAGALCDRPAQRRRCGLCRGCERERCPFAVVGEVTRRADASSCPMSRNSAPAPRAPSPNGESRPSTCPWTVLFGKRAEEMHRERSANAAPGHRAGSGWHPAGEGDQSRVAPAGGRQQVVSDHHRRPQRRRPVRARPDGRAVAGAGRRLRRDACATSTAMPAKRWPWASARRSPCCRRRPRRAWRSARRSPISPRRRSPTSARCGCRPTGWPRSGTPARTPRCTTRCARSRWSCARNWIFPFRSARIRCRCRRYGSRTGSKQKTVAPVSLIVSAFARVGDVRRALTPQLRLGCRRYRTVADRSRRRQEPARRLGPGAGVQPQPADCRPTSTMPSC